MLAGQSIFCQLESKAQVKAEAGNREQLEAVWSTHWHIHGILITMFWSSEPTQGRPQRPRLSSKSRWNRGGSWNRSILKLNIYAFVETVAWVYLKVGSEINYDHRFLQWSEETIWKRSCHQCHSLNLLMTSQCPQDKINSINTDKVYQPITLRHLPPLQPQWTPPPPHPHPATSFLQPHCTFRSSSKALCSSCHEGFAHVPPSV